jgi:hypothetical protein
MDLAQAFTEQQQQERVLLRDVEAEFRRMVSIREAEIGIASNKNANDRSTAVLDARRLLADYHRINAARHRCREDLARLRASVTKVEAAVRASDEAWTALVEELDDRAVGFNKVKELAEAFRDGRSDVVNTWLVDVLAKRNLDDEEIRVLEEEGETIRSLLVLGARLICEDVCAEAPDGTTAAAAAIAAAVPACPICLDRESTVVLTPCGHAMCAPCSERLRLQQPQPQPQPQPLPNASRNLPWFGAEFSDRAQGQQTSTGAGCPVCRRPVQSTVRVFW